MNNTSLIVEDVFRPSEFPDLRQPTEVAKRGFDWLDLTLVMFAIGLFGLLTYTVLEDLRQKRIQRQLDSATSADK